MTTTETKLPKFLTIREVARTGLLPEYSLRLLEKQGKLPGVRVGRCFKVNFDRLIDLLNGAEGGGLVL